MNKKLLSIFVLTFCFIGNLWVSAQSRWTEGNSVGAGEFYLYNLGANRYLNQGSSWDTHAIVDGAGLKVTIASFNGGYSIDTGVVNGQNANNHSLGLVGNGVWMDIAQTKFNLDVVTYGGYTNAFTLSYTENGTTYYLGWAGGGGDAMVNANPLLGQLQNEVITITTYPNTENFLWMLIKPEYRDFDHTSSIINPDFERGNQADYTTDNGIHWDRDNLYGWTRGGFWKQISSQSFTNATFAEKWVSSGILGEDNIYQDIDLPAGTYTLSVTAQAINERSSNAPCTKGVNLYLGNSKTLIGAAGTYEVTTTHNGGSLRLGVEILSDNDVNWVAFDNVRLYEKDFYFSANSATVDNGTTSYNGINLHGASGSVR